MKFCTHCHCQRIRSRQNYTHGAKSKSITTLSCKACGSHKIEVKDDRARRFRRRK